jgi:acylphosphatase
MADTIARLVHYRGRVQGVGFRATAASLASRYPVAGWVRNLPDGRVQILAEGAADAVESFLEAVSSYWGDDIAEEQRQEQGVSGMHQRFRIAH